MPNIFLTNAERYENITRPVAMGVTKQIIQRIGLPANTQIMFNGKHDQALQPGTTLTPSKEAVSWPNSDKVTVTIDEDYWEDHLSSQVLRRPEHVFIFHDPLLDTFIKPVYSSTRVQLTFQCRTKDYDSAMRWRDDFKARYAEGRDIVLYEAIYSYPIPEKMLTIVQEIWRLREAQGGYGDTLDKYFLDHVDNRMRILTNQAGKNPMIVIAENQDNINILNDFAGVPTKGSSSSDTEVWTIEVPFVFHYEQAVGCDMGYPLMIHNQLIPYRPNDADNAAKNDTNRQQFRSLSGGHLRAFEAGYNEPFQIRTAGVQIPAWDEFIPRSTLLSTMRVFTVLVNITPEDKKSLFNLRDIFPEYEFIPGLEDLLRQEVPYLCVPYKSIFNLSLYQGADLLDASWITIDPQFNVSATTDLNLRRTFHVRFSFLLDWSLLPRGTINRYRRFGRLLNDILRGMHLNIPEMRLIGDGFATPDEINLIAALLSKQQLQQIRFNTVETLYLETQRKDN